MSKVYETPEWASINMNDIYQLEYYLEILKDGVIIDCINLNDIKKSYYILGRQPDIVDIQMDHPSISRQHAILQFRNDNCLMIMDWNSAQGTFVNKKQLEKDVYQRLYVGDILKFGCSTRMYIVNGPDEQLRQEYDSIGMQKYREKLTDNSNKIKEKQNENMNISWGFREDAPQEEEDDDNQDDVNEKDNLPFYMKNDENYDRKYGDKFQVEIDESEINEKDKQLLEKIRSKELKVQNMQEENRRIYMKDGQDGGLTENQLKTVNRNDERISQLMEQVEVLVAQIKDKNLQREKQSTLSKPNENFEEKDDNDDIRDTTNETADQGTNWRLRKKLGKSTGTTFSSNTEKKSYSYEDLLIEKETIEGTISDLQKQIDIANNVINNTRILENETEIEIYIKNNNVKEATANLKVLEKSYNELQSKLKSVESLVQLAAPALPSMRKKENFEDKKINNSIHDINNDNDNNNNNNNNNDISNNDNDTSNSNSNSNSNSSSNNNSTETTRATTSPVSKKKNEKHGMQSLSSLIEFIEAEKSKDKESKDNDNNIENNMKRSRESDTITAPQKKVKGPIGPSLPTQGSNFEFQDDTNTTIENKNSIIDDKEIAWKPPANQDGSGRTSLNEKLGY